MSNLKSVIFLVSAFLSTVLLQSCSGSSGSNPKQSVVNMQGLAAEGSALANAAVEIRGSNGAAVSTQTDSSGKFSADISSLEYPVMLKATGNSTYFSIAYAGGYVNVTPFTTLVLSRLLTAGPATVFSNFDKSALKSEADLKTAAASIVQRFSAVSGLSGLSSIDFFNDKFSPNPSTDVHDALLEALQSEMTTSGQTLNQIVNAIIAENTPGTGSCASGQHLENSVCVANIRACAITNGTGEQLYVNGSWEACAIVSCQTNYSVSGGSCAANSRACVTLPSHANQGAETWTGSAWGSCQIANCASGYDLVVNTCVATVPPTSQAIVSYTSSLLFARKNFEVESIGGKTLLRTMESGSDDGYIFDSGTAALPFGRGASTVNTFKSGTVVGNELYYHLQDAVANNTITFHRININTGGTSSPVVIPSSATSGYHEAGRIALHSRGTSIYYRARSAASQISAGSLFKYDTTTAATSVVIADLNTQAVTYPEKLVSENVLIYQQDYMSGNARFTFRAVDANDQLITLLQTTPGEYSCNTGISPFKDCAPVFLEGHAIYLLDASAGSKFVITDGTLAGTRFLDVPYHYGGLASLTKVQNKLVFSALKKSDLTDGYQLYTFSLAGGFQLLKRVSKLNSSDTSNVEIKAIATSGSDAYIVLRRTLLEYVNGTFVYTHSGEILKTQGTAETTTTQIASLNPATIALLDLGLYERGPLLAMKGHLVFSTSTSSMTDYAMKSLSLTDQSVTTLRSDYQSGKIIGYKKDPTFERVIVLEPLATTSSLLAKPSWLQ